MSNKSINDKLKDITVSVIASKELRRERVAICNGCKHFKRQLICGQCGCLVSAKVTMQRSKCPRDKW